MSIYMMCCHKTFSFSCLLVCALINSSLKLRCDERFTHTFTACGCVFKEITLVGSNQCNYFKDATAYSKRTLKTTVATQLNWLFPKSKPFWAKIENDLPTNWSFVCFWIIKDYGKLSCRCGNGSYWSTRDHCCFNTCTAVWCFYYTAV